MEYGIFGSSVKKFGCIKCCCCAFDIGHSRADAGICCPFSLQSSPMEVSFGSAPLRCDLCDAHKPQAFG